MYSYVKDNDKNEKTAKGIKKYLIKKITHQDYKDTLQNNKQIYHSMKSLSCFDDKRYIHADGQTSYAYGHYKINN